MGLGCAAVEWGWSFEFRRGRVVSGGGGAGYEGKVCAEVDLSKPARHRSVAPARLVPRPDRSTNTCTQITSSLSSRSSSRHLKGVRPDLACFSFV